ncbi:MAG: signal peptidase II [Clostridia bacterium]|nr:signal peptidase II [Clostridia bacterium]
MTAVLSVIMCLALVGADQFIKYLVVEYLKPIEYTTVIDGVLRFRYVENTGAVFGSFAAHTVFLTVFSIILLAFTIYFLVTNKSKSKLVNFCLLLMISGGIGNIIDRIRLQYVVDYIEPLFVEFAVFNFADCLITVGAFALIGYLIFDLIRDYKKEKAPADDTLESDDSSEDKKSHRFPMKRRVKKAGVEGDKEAVVFNAVIDGASPDDALNEIKMGIEQPNEFTAVVEQDDSITSEQAAPIEVSSDIEAEVNDDVDESTDTATIPENTVDVALTENKPDEAAPENKSKKISIDSIEEIDFSLFE